MNESTNGLRSELESYYESKTQLPSWNFAVDLEFASTYNGGGISRFHVVDVIVPQYNMKPITTKFGPFPYAFPIFDDDGGKEIKITFEDDRRGTILKFINELQRTVVTTDGFHNPPSKTKIGNIFIHLNNYEDRTVASWRAMNVFYLGADDVTLNYGDTGVLKYAITFGTDVIQYAPVDVGTPTDSSQSYSGPGTASGYFSSLKTARARGIAASFL